MPGQHLTYVANRIDDRIREPFRPEVFAHFRHNPFPQFIAAMFVNAFIAEDRKLVNPRRDKNQHPVTRFRLLHTEPLKSVLRRRQDVLLEFASLNINPDLAGSPLFRIANGLNNPIMIEPADEFLGSHRLTN